MTVLLDRKRLSTAKLVQRLLLGDRLPGHHGCEARVDDLPRLDRELLAANRAPKMDGLRSLILDSAPPPYRIPFRNRPCTVPCAVLTASVPYFVP